MFFGSVAVCDPEYVMHVGLIGRFAYVQSPSASSTVAETGSCFSLEGPGMLLREVLRRERATGSCFSPEGPVMFRGRDSLGRRGDEYMSPLSISIFLFLSDGGAETRRAASGARLMSRDVRNNGRRGYCEQWIHSLSS
jgi:hypothetical protein